MASTTSARFSSARVRGAGAVLLALEMGVGKTLVALMVLSALTARRVLICCPLRVVPVWEQQIERHLDLHMIVVSLDDNVGSVANKKKLAEDKLKLGRPLAARSSSSTPTTCKRTAP
jgi:superfamily II DNA or RNA helicase